MRGLVDREADPADARVTYAALGKAGKRLLADALATAQQVGGECLAGVPAPQPTPCSPRWAGWRG